MPTSPTVISLCTPAARKLGRMIGNCDQGDPDTLERYYSPLSEVVVLCTTDEREDYEAEERGRDLTADVLDAREFVEFCHHLKHHFGLRP